MVLSREARLPNRTVQRSSRRTSGGDGLGVPAGTRSGDEWKRHDWQNSRGRVHRPAALKVGVTGDLRPYRLRGSFVSLLLWEGRSLAYVAEQAGHSIATLAKHYAGVIRELEDKPRVPASEAIPQAREKCLVCDRCANGSGGRIVRMADSPAMPGMGDTGLEPVTSALSRRRSPS